MMPAALQRIRGRSELGMALFLLLLGAIVTFDATQLPSSFAQRGPVGPAAVPFVVGIGLILTALLLAAEVLRGHTADPEEGEDIDLSTGTDWRTVLTIAGVFLANTVLMEPLGWPISGALLFWGCAFAFGARRHIRNAIIGLGISFGTYFLFELVLGLSLPGGVLGGVL
jgi:putative tricarboxylic transport membrane protein